MDRNSQDDNQQDLDKACRKRDKRDAEYYRD